MITKKTALFSLAPAWFEKFQNAVKSVKFQSITLNNENEFRSFREHTDSE